MRNFILLLSLLSLYSCYISLGLFAPQFYKEIDRFKYIIYNDSLDRSLREYTKTLKVGKEYNLKHVDLNNIEKTCNLDFEIELVQSFDLPASNHQINHINVGGALISKITQTYNNYWKATIGVVLEDTAEPNYVHLLVYHVIADFSKSGFEEYLNRKLDMDELDLVHAFFYNICFDIYENELLPIKG